MNTERKITLNIAKRVLGMPEHFEIVTEECWQELLDKWKMLVVRARENGDVAHETELNNVKAWIVERLRNTRSKLCPRCGEIKARESEVCQQCNRMCKIKTETMNETMQSLQGTVGQLRRIREQREQARDQAAADVERLTAAIQALEGTSISEPESYEGPSITEIVESAAKQINESTPGAVFDHQTLVNVA